MLSKLVKLISLLN